MSTKVFTKFPKGSQPFKIGLWASPTQLITAKENSKELSISLKCDFASMSLENVRVCP